jgi:hypothetical protein
LGDDTGFGTGIEEGAQPSVAKARDHVKSVICYLTGYKLCFRLGWLCWRDIGQTLTFRTYFGYRLTGVFLVKRFLMRSITKQRKPDPDSKWQDTNSCARLIFAGALHPSTTRPKEIPEDQAQHRQ